MSTDAEIRPAIVRDALEIQKLYDENVPGDVAGLAYRHSDWPKYVGVSHVLLLVAVVQQEGESRIVGLLLGYDLVNWGYVDILVVGRHSRGLGVGSALLQRFEERGKRKWIASELATDPKDDEIRAFMHKRNYFVAGTTEWRVRDLSGEVESRRKGKS